LLVATLRPRALGLDDAQTAALERLERAARANRIDLAPLSEPETRLLIDRALADVAVPIAMRRSVARISEGNPFFAEELVHVARERFAAEGARHAARAALPSSIRATLLDRWHALDRAERTIVAHAAVIGRTFDLALLARTLAVAADDVLPALRHARDVQLVEELSDRTFRFRHALTREAIYEEFLGAQVRPLHRTIAETLETLADAERSREDLAYHWWAAGDRERAARYNEPAGDAAASVHAHEEALVFYERALESRALAPAERARLHEKIADRHFILGATDRARDAYATAAERFAEARDDDREAHCRVRFALASYSVALTEPVAPLEAFLARLAPEAIVARGRAHRRIGLLAAAHYNGATCYTIFGLHEEANAQIERALAIARDQRFTHGVESALAIAALSRCMSGDLAGARAALAALPAAITNQVTLAGAVAAGTVVGCRLDDHELASRWFDAAREALLAEPESACGEGLAEILVRRGEIEAAQTLLERAIPPCERPRGVIGTLLAAARYGTPATIARARAQLAASAAGEHETPERAGLALFDATLARKAGRPAEAALLARAAAVGFRAFRYPLYEAAAHELAGDTAEALALYERTGAVADLRRLRAPAPEPAPRAAAVLSHREREIALLVARGNGNAEIGRTLNISHKTVEKHLASAFRKLGFTSRAQLAVYIGAQPDS
jgi:DNA-binding CsgD family transcriptional regulator/tetratricopeptide (TPR) repeat protein